jgi:hypothetical protein
MLRPNAMMLLRGIPSAARTAERHGLAIIETGLAEAGKLAFTAL